MRSWRCLSYNVPCVCRQMLFCRVTLGKSFLQFSAMKMAHAPPGHHSVIGRPSVNGLAYAEYVIYRGEQVRELDYINTTTKQLLFYFICINYWSSYHRLIFNKHLCVFAGLPRVPHHIPDHQARKHTSIPSSRAAEILNISRVHENHSDCYLNISYTRFRPPQTSAHFLRPVRINGFILTHNPLCCLFYLTGFFPHECLQERVALVSRVLTLLVLFKSVVWISVPHCFRANGKEWNISSWQTRSDLFPVIILKLTLFNKHYKLLAFLYFIVSLLIVLLFFTM